MKERHALMIYVVSAWALLSSYLILMMIYIASLNDWRVVVDFNEDGEGFIELLAMSILFGVFIMICPYLIYWSIKNTE